MAINEPRESAIQFIRDILLENHTKYEIKIFTEQFVCTIIIGLMMWSMPTALICVDVKTKNQSISTLHGSMVYSPDWNKREPSSKPSQAKLDLHRPDLLRLFNPQLVLPLQPEETSGYHFYK